MSEQDLLSEAQRLGIHVLALTDINNTSACLNFIRLAPRYGVRPVVGVDFRRGAKQMFVALAKNNEGFHEINQLLSHHLHTGEAMPERAPNFHHVYVIYPYHAGIPVDSLCAHEFIGVAPIQPPRSLLSNPATPRDKYVLLITSTFRHKRDFNIHRILRAIDNNTLLSKLPPDEEGDPTDKMYAPADIMEKCSDYSFLIKNSEALLARCHIYFNFSDEKPSQNQHSYTGDRDQDYDLIHQLCWEGVHYRYGEDVTDEIIDRIHKELELIKQMDFLSYFLINWDIVNYARSKNYFYVGRGSGANSIVAYLLRITDVDPIELDLYFERFINLFRKNPPDFDLDFSWRDREDITRYIFERFPNVALLGTYNTFQYRGALREVGKVFGLPKSEIDHMVSDAYMPTQVDRITRLVLKYAGYLQGRPNHLGIHAGGILISQRPISYFSATYMPPKGFATVQFDMVIAEDIGLYKFDVLGQRGLAKIKECLSIIAYNHPEASAIDIHDIRRFKQDPLVAHMISQAECLGCFYIESPAMRMLLRKLTVDNYLGLVAASSIIRPGVAKSGMMREYILRHKNPDIVAERAHPVLLRIMPDTYGVMVYQEDVIKVAHYFAGLSLGEADVLRRGMSGKYRSRAEFDSIRDKFVDNCVLRGHPLHVVEEVWRQIESFAGYAFSKGHSASYAVESYQSLFLKTYYPLEYMVAVINNGGGFYHVDTYIHEARMLGATIESPCVNHSRYESIIRGSTIYLGFGLVKDLDTASINRLVEEREAGGPYLDFADFVERTGLSLEQVKLLIRCAALRFSGQTKPALLWHAHFMLAKHDTAYRPPQLFRSPQTTHTLPELDQSSLSDAYDDMELLGFPLCSPFTLAADPPNHTCIQALTLAAHVGKQVTMRGYLVSIKLTRTVKGEPMYFGTFLDDEGHFIDTVHFPPVAVRYPFRGRGLYLLCGIVTSEFDFYTLEVSHMLKEKWLEDPRFVENKNPSLLKK